MATRRMDVGYGDKWYTAMWTRLEDDLPWLNVLALRAQRRGFTPVITENPTWKPRKSYTLWVEHKQGTLRNNQPTLSDRQLINAVTGKTATEWDAFWIMKPQDEQEQAWWDNCPLCSA